MCLPCSANARYPGSDILGEPPSLRDALALSSENISVPCAGEKTPCNSCVEQRPHLVSLLGKLRHGTARAGLQLFSCSKGRCGAWQGARVSCVLVLRLPLLHPSDRGRTSAEPCACCACPGVSLPAQGNFHGQPGQGVRLGCSDTATASSLTERAPSRACFPPLEPPKHPHPAAGAAES